MMFCKYNIFVLLAASLVALAGSQGQGTCTAGPQCNSVKDCHCGDQCVDMSDLKLCHSASCRCFRGCAVGDIFILPGFTQQNAYCNSCTCSSSDGIPSCSRRGWCNLPCHVPVYQDNPACKGHQGGGQTQGY